MRYKITALILALLTSFCLVACGGSKTEELPSGSELPKETEQKETERRVTVQAGDIIYYSDEIQRNLDLLLEDYELTGNPLTGEERAAAAQEIVDEYSIRALIKAQLKKLGLDEPDKNTLYDMRSDAQTAYDAYWKKFRDSEASTSYTDDELTAYLEENGINIDYFFEELLNQYETEKIMEYYHINIEITDADVDSFYKDNYVQMSRERYENNIPLFEEEVLYGDSYSAYVPEGYRLLHQIVIPVPENILKELKQVEEEANTYAAQAEEAYNKIAELAIEGKDTKKQTELYQSAMDHIDELSVKYGELWQSVLTATNDECDEIYARLQMGESFEDLMKLYDPEDVLFYHEKSQVWSEELMAGARTLINKGDVSQPTLCSDGVHILCYYDDIPGGEDKLENEEDRTMLRNALIQQRTFDKLKELTEPWAKEFDLVTDLSTLQY